MDMTKTLANTFIRCPITGILISLLLFIPISINTVAIDVDPDESGVNPTTIDCDRSVETSVCLDYNDDIAEKKIWIGSNEIYASGGVYIEICGMAAGNTDDRTSHTISIGGTVRVNINAHSCFSSTRFGWYRVFLPGSYFIGDSWNLIQIKCTNHQNDWDTEVLYLGIDTTFQQSYNEPMPDFQRSSWSNSYNPQNPSWFPLNSNGELMIRVYPYHEHASKLDFDTSREGVVPIDDSNDLARKTFTLSQQDIAGVTRAHLWVWGYAWGTAEFNNHNLYININGVTADFNAYDLFQENCWGWGIIDMLAQDWLVVGTNTISFSDWKATYDRENFAIGVDTNAIYNPPHSYWNYNDGQTHESGPNSGELMVRLELFESEYDLAYRELAVTGIEDYDLGGSLTNNDKWVLQGLFDDDGWDIVLDHEEEDVLEGDFYEEHMASPYQVWDGADIADFHYHTGHGGRLFMPLKDNDQSNTADPWDDNYVESITYPSTSQNILEFDYSSDGLDKDTDWVFYSACKVLKGTSGYPSGGDNIWRTALFHGVHYVFGYYGDNVDGELTPPGSDWYIASYFSYYVLNGYSVSESFRMANEYNYEDDWFYYYHSQNMPEYIWGVDDGPTFDSYEHGDIHFNHG